MMPEGASLRPKWSHDLWATSTAVPSSFLLPNSQQVGNQTFGVHWLKQWLDAAVIRVYSMGAGRGGSRYTLAKLHSSASSGLKPTFICSAGRLIYYSSLHPSWFCPWAAFACHMTGAAPATRAALASAESLYRKSVAPTGVFLFSLRIVPPFVSDWNGLLCLAVGGA